MASRFRSSSRRSVWLLLSLAMAMMAAAWSVPRLVRGRKPPLSIDSLESFVVERDDLETTLLAGGDLQPAKQTEVNCKVEDITDTEGTLVLSVIDNGAKVKKGDVLCRLDSSELDRAGPTARNPGQPDAGNMSFGPARARDGPDRLARV